MTGNARVAVITGASSGVGKEAAKALAAQGWRVIGTGRDQARMAAAEAEIRAASNTGEVEMLRADLSLLADARRLAKDIAELTDRLDVLINNAGGMTDKLEMTPEGLEANYAGNHLGPFVLTQELIPLLRKTARDAPAGSVRVLMTSSNASEMAPPIDLDDLQNLATFDPGLAYCAGKLANVLFAAGLAERLKDAGITAHAYHPGVVASNFSSHATEQTQQYLASLDAVSEAQGADTLVWLATDPEGGRSSGGYWSERQARQPNPLAQDSAFVERFWKASEKLVASVA